MAKIEKSFRQMQKEVVKKMSKRTDERWTKLDPYTKPKKINVRDLDELLLDEESDMDDEEEYLP